MDVKKILRRWKIRRWELDRKRLLEELLGGRVRTCGGV